MSREDIEEAIEVLEDASAEMLTETGDKNYYGEAIAVLRQVLEVNMSEERVDETTKQEHEPVAWASTLDFDDDDIEIIPARAKGKLGTSNCNIPLYTTPPKREWVGLTDEEIGEVISGQFAERNYWVKITKALEAKLKEKNT